jgi:ferredoxin
VNNPADDIYEQLARALDRLPNGFPRTPSHGEIALLRKICPPEEAQLASLLSEEMEPVEHIAERLGMSVPETRKKCLALVRRGLAWFDRHSGSARFRLAPFVVGIYEAQLDAMDHEMAHLVEHYLADGGLAGLMKYNPALQRVVPARGAVTTEWILPYDEVKKLLEGAESFQVRDCICRKERRLNGYDCGYPLDVCLYFSTGGLASGEGSLTREEALSVLDRAEAAGLVHSVSNVREGVWYVCNCCGCCCAVLRGITEYGLNDSVARANYYAEIDPDSCTGCGICLERCQVRAISMENGIATTHHDKCIGCGLCVTGCPSGSVRLLRRPDAETVHPPENYHAWEHERRRNRKMKN